MHRINFRPVDSRNSFLSDNVSLARPPLYTSRAKLNASRKRPCKVVWQVYEKVERQTTVLFGESRDCQWGDSEQEMFVKWMSRGQGSLETRLAGSIGFQWVETAGWAFSWGASWVTEDAEVWEWGGCVENCPQAYMLQLLALPGILQQKIPSTDTHPTFPGSAHLAWAIQEMDKRVSLDFWVSNQGCGLPWWRSGGESAC